MSKQDTKTEAGSQSAVNTVVMWLYIFSTPIMPLFMALREYRYIAIKGDSRPSVYSLLKTHYQFHCEKIKYWDQYWEKEKHT